MALRNIPKHPITILRAIYGLDTHGSIGLSGICHVYADRLGVWLLCLTDDNLDDFAILAKIVRAA